MVKSNGDIQQLGSSSAGEQRKRYKGVRMRSWGSWVSEIRAPGQKTRIWLGSYSTPEAAARAYDVAVLCLKGTSPSNCGLNFPSLDYTVHIPRHSSPPISPKSIQRLAQAAANDAAYSAYGQNFIPSAYSYEPHSRSEEITQSPLEQSQSSWSPLTNFEEIELQYSCESDMMFDNVLMEPPLTAVFQDLWDEADIRLWSFS